VEPPDGKIVKIRMGGSSFAFDKHVFIHCGEVVGEVPSLTAYAVTVKRFNMIYYR
jgi:hypothetical protein